MVCCWVLLSIGSNTREKAQCILSSAFSTRPNALNRFSWSSHIHNTARAITISHGMSEPCQIQVFVPNTCFSFYTVLAIWTIHQDTAEIPRGNQAFSWSFEPPFASEKLTFLLQSFYPFPITEQLSYERETKRPLACLGLSGLPAAFEKSHLFPRGV